MTGDESAPGGGADGGVEPESWSATERALLEAALDFYNAAGGVIDYADRERPQLRQDAAGLDAVRRAMREMERCVVAAHAAGALPARIAEIARIEPETIELILQRHDAAPSPPGGLSAARGRGRRAP